MLYDTTFEGYSATVNYYFTNRLLYEVLYLLTEYHSTESLYISDYNDIKDRLTTEHGSPVYDRINEKEKAPLGYSEEEKLINGYTSYGTIWETENTDIFLNMSASNFEVITGIRYTSKTISPRKTR